jgi:putative acid phosphatase of HAD superfamily subfamily IIIB
MIGLASAHRLGLPAALGVLLVFQACTPQPPQTAATATSCPPVPADHAPVAEKPLNIDKVKKQLREYHNSNVYDADLAATLVVAGAYANGRFRNVAKPAVVLDIDETSLSNWPTFVADDFGFFPKAAACNIPSNEACGFNIWIDMAVAPAIPPTLTFFNDLKSKQVPIFFITGRRHSQRAVTIRNLRAAGFEGWARLDTRPDDDTASSIQPFKTGKRQEIEREGYTIIANIGDQQSDLEGGSAECTFKLPNPFYFIP